jgi:hypothetical protein
LDNFISLRDRGPNSLANSWLERSLPTEIRRVQCKTLDSVLKEINIFEKFHFLKIDAQGAEYQILKGGHNYLVNDCYGMQLELFTLPMYKDIKLLDEVVEYLAGLGFDLIKRFPPHGTFNSQCDCVFLRRDIEDDIARAIRGIYGLPDKKKIPDKNKICGAGLRKDVGNENTHDSISLLKDFKDKHIGQRCVIIGNGPSLNKMDLSFLKEEITFGLNKIYLLFDKWKFTPTYYASVNPLVLEQCSEEISKIPSTKFISINGKNYFNGQNDIIFLKSIGIPSFSKDPQYGVWEGHTVTYVALQLAFYMGFEEVVLIGVDHNFEYTGKPNQEVVASGKDVNHFHPDYFGKGVRWNLPDLKKSEIAYRMARKMFENDGRIVLDATVDGKLDIFPKINYLELFNKDKKSDKEIQKDSLSKFSYLIKKAKRISSEAKCN